MEGGRKQRYEVYRGSLSQDKSMEQGK